MACVENYYYFCKKQLKMVLTYPIFLWALFSLSIPIIIHLFNFRKYKTLYFSNTRFVDHVKKDTKTRNKLKQYLILLMRLLMLTALIIAFARPVIPIKEQDKYREVDAIAIYIDNSFSMESESEQGPLLTQAIDKALKLVNALPDDIHYYLITNDFLPEHQRAYNKSDIIQIIGNIDISPNIKSIDQVIKKAIVLKSESKELDIYIISDFQKKFIKPVDIDNENISISIMPLNVNGQNNIFIDSCWFTEPVRIFNQSDELLVKIRNISDVSYVDIPVKLYINDTLKAISSLNIDAKEDKTIKLGYTNTSKGLNKGVVSISDYPVTFDNELYFSYRIAEEINVLIINGQLENKYLTSLFDTDEDYIKFKQLRAGQERFDEFPFYNLIVLNSVTNISSGLMSELEAFVSRGNSVLIIPSDESEASMLNQVLEVFDIGKLQLDKKEISKINSIDYKHVLFRDVFVEYEDKPDLPLISNAFFLNLNSKSGAASVLSDQTDNCLFATKNYNGGKIYFSAFSLDDNHEFLKHPLFVAMFYNIIIQSQPIDDLYFIAGRNNSVDIQVNSENSRVYDVLHIVDSVGVDIIPMYRNVQGVLNVLIPEVMLEKGHYEIVANNDLLGVFSLNYDRTESILEYYSEKELSEELTSAGLKEFLLINTAEKDLDSIIREQKKGKELWRLFVFIALFFITCEILIIRLMK